MRNVIIPKNPDNSIQLRTGVVFNEGMRSPWDDSSKHYITGILEDWYQSDKQGKR